MNSSPGVEHCFGKGVIPTYPAVQAANTGECYPGDTRQGTNVRREEGETTEPPAKGQSHG